MWQGDSFGNRKSPGEGSDQAYVGAAVASGDHSSRSSCKVVLKAVQNPLDGPQMREIKRASPDHLQLA